MSAPEQEYRPEFHWHILRLEDRDITMHVREHPDCIHARIHSTNDGRLKDSEWDQVISWYGDILNTYCDERRYIHVLDPQHVLTT